MKHCLEAKPFEPQAEIILPTTDAMLGFIQSGLLTIQKWSASIRNTCMS